MNSMSYLDDFNKRLRKNWRGSLVKVEQVKEANAREYMHNLARAGYVEHVTHGWYWVPDEFESFYDFLRTDKNFKVVSRQSAASFWNNDFIHREVYSLKVKSKSYARALKAFAEKKGWHVEVQVVKDVDYMEMHGLKIEPVSESIIGCLQLWAFADAFSALYLNRAKVRLKELSKRAYWKRLSKTQIRVRQILEYGSKKINELAERRIFDVKEVRIYDEFIRSELDEAVEKVMELA
ncbi:MAG: hypothetical protein AB1665_01500 [Candidatus Thermoplasmatota archaeon]